jgi:N-acetylmuramoyl-L-alanine amidase
MPHAGIALDYGHGGWKGGLYPGSGAYQTPGGKQYHHTDSPPLSIYEGVVNRMIAARVVNLLRASGVRVYDVVANVEWREWPVAWEDMEQSDVALGTRVSRANRRPSWLYVSLHGNAVGNTIRGPSQSARGIEVYTSVGQTGSDKVADALVAAFKRHCEPDMPVRRGEWSDGDVDYERDFYVLKRTRGAAVLGEVGFFTNRQDATLLLDDSFQERVATAYVEALLPFVARVA